VNVTAHIHVDVFEALKDDWRALLTQSTSNTIFNTWQWHYHWWVSYHPGDLWILTVSDDAQLYGIASFFIADEDGKKVLHFVGCEDVTDYLDIIVHKEHAETVYTALANFLSENQAMFDVIDLCNIPEASLTRTLFVEILQGCGFQPQIKQMEVCPVLHLEGGWEDYLANLPKKQRHEIRRKLRKADAQSQDGSLQWYIVDETHDLESEMDKFLDLMAKSQQAKAQFLQQDDHIAFFRSVVPALFQEGWVQMSFLTINDQPVTAYLNFDYDNRILVYNSGLDASEYGFLSPGIVLLSYNIQHAIDNRRTIFDFLRGNETYKYRMGAQDTPIFNLNAVC
jgi:CelD/BcsL family acetyltransferase involved in cellulose biosynthesis